MALAFIPSTALALSIRPPTTQPRSFTPHQKPLPAPTPTITCPSQIHMKKARFQQPLQPRRPDQMPLPEDGTPVFTLFVRTPRAKLWYPIGAVQGDNRSKSLIDAMKGGFLRSMYANALDKGIAQTVYGKDSSRFMSNALRMYPQLKKYQRDLEFGYRVAAVGLEQQPTKIVTRELALPFPSWAKKKLENLFKPGSK